MRYIGGKEKLLGFIDQILIDKKVKAESFTDIFSGTSIVAQHFKKKNYSIISNDNLYFSYLLQRTYIQNNSVPQFKKLKKGIEKIYEELNNLKGKKGYFFQQYAPSGKQQRMFLTDENAMKIDAIQEQIQKWKDAKLITLIEEEILKCSLVEAVPFVSNISGTYGAYLKNWDKRAFKKLTLEIPKFIINEKQNFAYNKDSNALIREIESDILYLDPPYNGREYISNYHLLETVALNDKIELKGITGTRTDDHKYKSPFCKKSFCVEALQDLVEQSNAKYILMSYNSEGIIPDTEIQKIFKAKGKHFARIDVNYPRYKSNSNGTQKREIQEYIYYVESTIKTNSNPKEVSTVVNEDENQFELFENSKPKKTTHVTTPNGILDSRNQLNDLTGKQWLYRTNSIEISETSEEEMKLIDFITQIEETKYSTNGSEGYAHKVRRIHPSPKPPQLMKKLIEFFTKEEGVVFDPFMGVGGTLLGASLINRNAIGIDLSQKYVDTYFEVCKTLNIKKQLAIVGNSKNIQDIKELANTTFDLIMTDPPYGDMMNRKKTGEATKKGKDTNPTPFTTDEDDLGNYPLPYFLEELKNIIGQSLSKLKDKKYVVVFCKDFQPTPTYNGMLHYDIVTKLCEIEGLYYKGYKIWYDKTINLFPYGYPYSYISNQLHQFILIFQKRTKK